MSEESDALKTAVAHHGSLLLLIGDAFYRYKNAYNEASWSFKRAIPLAVQQACLKDLEKAAERFRCVLEVGDDKDVNEA